MFKLCVFYYVHYVNIMHIYVIMYIMLFLSTCMLLIWILCYYYEQLIFIILAIITHKVYNFEFAYHTYVFSIKETSKIF